MGRRRKSMTSIIPINEGPEQNGAAKLRLARGSGQNQGDLDDI